MQKGMLVDNKAFTGEHIVINGRATFVLVKKPTWKIAPYSSFKIRKLDYFFCDLGFAFGLFRFDFLG